MQTRDIPGTTSSGDQGACTDWVPQYTYYTRPRLGDTEDMLNTESKTKQNIKS